MYSRFSLFLAHQHRHLPTVTVIQAMTAAVQHAIAENARTAAANAIRAETAGTASHVIVAFAQQPPAANAIQAETAEMALHATAAFVQQHRMGTAIQAVIVAEVPAIAGNAQINNAPLKSRRIAKQ